MKKNYYGWLYIGIGILSATSYLRIGATVPLIVLTFFVFADLSMAIYYFERSSCKSTLFLCEEKDVDALILATMLFLQTLFNLFAIL